MRPNKPIYIYRLLTTSRNCTTGCPSLPNFPHLLGFCSIASHSWPFMVNLTFRSRRVLVRRTRNFWPCTSTWLRLMRFVTIDLSSARSSIDERDYAAGAIALSNIGGFPTSCCSVRLFPSLSRAPYLVERPSRAPVATNLVTLIFCTEKTDALSYT